MKIKSHPPHATNNCPHEVGSKQLRSAISTPCLHLCINIFELRIEKTKNYNYPPMPTALQSHHLFSHPILRSGSPIIHNHLNTTKITPQFNLIWPYSNWKHVVSHFPPPSHLDCWFLALLITPSFF